MEGMYYRIMIICFTIETLQYYTFMSFGIIMQHTVPIKLFFMQYVLVAQKHLTIGYMRLYAHVNIIQWMIHPIYMAIKVSMWPPPCSMCAWRWLTSIIVIAWNIGIKHFSVVLVHLIHHNNTNGRKHSDREQGCNAQSKCTFYSQIP